MPYRAMIALIAVFLPETAGELRRGFRRADGLGDGPGFTVGRGDIRHHVWFEPVTAPRRATRRKTSPMNRSPLATAADPLTVPGGR